MKTAFVVLIALALSACTTYEVRKPDGTELTIRSMREFPGGISVDYKSVEGATLKVETGEVRNGTSQLVDALLEKLAEREGE